MNPVGHILRQSENKESLNILTSCTHEAYESGLTLTGHNFYAYRATGIKDWNAKYRPIPKNYVILDKDLGTNQIPSHVKFDLVLSQNKFGQFQVLSQIANHMHVPLISLEHTLPVPQWDNNMRNYVKSARGNLNVFISKYSVNQWGFDIYDPTVRVIEHMIDTDFFNPNLIRKDLPGPRNNHILSVVNDWINRDWCCNFSGWTRITKGLPVRVLGDTKGLSETAKSPEHLMMEYSNSRIFLNTSTISPVPTALMEAMSCGCACVTTATCMIPEIIKNGENGFISNDENELREYCKTLLKDEILAKKLGEAARKTIVEKYNKYRFIESWNNLFNEVTR